jgi:hypothetical protein
MHGYRGHFFRDPMFSVLVPFFHPYHSWIDAVLEMRIRISNHADQTEGISNNYGPLKDFLENSDKSDLKSIIKSMLENTVNKPYKDRISTAIDAEIDEF